ncbi:MAG: peptide-methionine (S)-S-oxide reductase MsrA [Bacteroidota bacterium]|jgi:peptide-methionine (S)-S-oxide reductase
MPNSKLEAATLGGGCFWCTEAVLQRLNGVEQVFPGYAGGTVPGKPTYREVCSGRTGHAEVVRVLFNPSIISYSELLTVFMTTHDPTTLNRQGADSGTQYRSVIFYHDQTQAHIAQTIVQELQPYYNDPIVTEISALFNFHEAEEDHINYYNLHPDQGYCRYVIAPKLSKLRAAFANKLKE